MPSRWQLRTAGPGKEGLRIGFKYKWTAAKELRLSYHNMSIIRFPDHSNCNFSSLTATQMRAERCFEFKGLGFRDAGA